jgi:hypothetical protein
MDSVRTLVASSFSSLLPVCTLAYETNFRFATGVRAKGVKELVLYKLRKP